MLITLDKQPCPLEATSIGDALGSAAAIVERQGRVIVEVVIDGDPWDQDKLGSAELRAGRADRIDLVSADLAALVDQTLTDASAALRDADDDQREAAEFIQTGSEPQAMQRLAQALSIWQSVQQAVTICADALDIDLDALVVDGRPLAERIERLDDQLQGVRTALQTRDLVSLADMLLYDLPDVVAEWREVLDTLKEHGEAQR